MRYKVYQFLVNRHEGIKERYHNMHDGAVGFKKMLSWVYLLWLNLCFYIFFCRFLGRKPEVEMFENKELLINESESSHAGKTIGSVADMVAKLSEYDVISFDIFDTLIFRPFSEPADLFYYVGNELEVMDFKRIRMEMEGRVRAQCAKERGSFEVTFEEIWQKIGEETGISPERGAMLEKEYEKKFCYANPFMLKVYKELLKMNKKLIVVSDMYLDRKFLAELLKQCGYTELEDLYVSCEYNKSKADGTLYSVVKEKYNKYGCVHVGDNTVSDVKNAKAAGFESVYYPNVNLHSKAYRTYDMSPVMGGGYRGIVNNHLWCGLKSYSMEYEYGFVYGGLFVLGYCRFIHEYVRQNGIDKVLFLSRDGHILSKIYEKLYGGAGAEYVYWSRSISAKLMFENNRYDYFRRFIYHKVNKKIRIEEILHSAGLDNMLCILPEKIKASDYLVSENADTLKEFILANRDCVDTAYALQHKMMKEYYGKVLAGCENVCAVDIGWAGSGAVSLDFLCRNVWDIPCKITGIVAGTNTVHNAEPDASETFLQSGKLVSYMFSQSDNRDIMKKHDLNRDYNVYWELLLSSPTGSFKGFERDENGNLKAVLSKPDVKEEAVNEIWNGIIDFVEEYMTHFGDCRLNEHISGRDAYAPMLAAAGKNESYLKNLRRNLNIEVDVK